MLQISNYIAVRELARSPQGVTWAARRADEPASAPAGYVVKVFETEHLGLVESVAAAQTFIDRAVLQRKLSQQGATHWAAVQDIGTADDPYFATELYPETAKTLVGRQGFVVGEHLLYAIVWSVVRGLTELRETFRRAHNNLKLQNIYLSGDLSAPTPKSLQVLLADPAAEGGSARDRAADLQSLGELIHLLVLRRPFHASPSTDEQGELIEADHWPLTYTAAWGRLGEKGRQWMELCSWLLGPTPSDRPSDLMAVAMALHPLAPAPRRRSRKVLAYAAVAALLVGGAAAALWQVQAAARAELVAANDRWFGAFVHAVQDPALQARWNKDEALRSLLDQIRKPQSLGLWYDPSHDAPLSLNAYRNSKAALAVAQRAERELTPERWPRLALVSATRQRFESRGWSQPAGYLANLERGVVPGPGVDVAAGVDRLLAATTQIDSATAWLDEQWLKFDQDLRTVQSANDPLLQTFARRLREIVGSTLRLTDASGIDGREKLKNCLPLAGELAGVAKLGLATGYDRDRISRFVDTQINTTSPTEQDIDFWIKAIGEYRLQRLDPAEEPLAQLYQSAEKLKTDVKRQTLDDDEQAKYEADQKALAETLRSLADRQFVKRDVDTYQGDLPLIVKDISFELDRMRQLWVRVDDPKEWLAAVDRPLPSKSSFLRNRWQTLMDFEQGKLGELAQNGEVFRRTKEFVARVRQSLVTLDTQYPSIPSGLRESFLDAAWQRREQDLLKLSDWADPQKLNPPTDDALQASIKSQAAAYQKWSDDLTALAKSFPLEKQILPPGYRPDLEWSQKQSAFWQDPLIRALVKPDVDRLTAVAAVDGLSRTDLAGAGSDGKSAEVALAAWRKLGTLEPAWPASASELTSELKIRRNLEGLLQRTVTNDAERKPAIEEVRRGGPQRWRRFVNLAVLDNPRQSPDALVKRLQAAIEPYSEMLMNASELAQLRPEARFNYTLYLSRVALTDPTDTNAQRAIRQMLDVAAGLKSRDDVRLLTNRLMSLQQPEPMAGDAALLAVPPPTAYTVSLSEQSTLTFARLALAGRPVYLCKTELSLGQFIDVIEQRGNWATANALLGSVPQGSAATTPFLGPRVWKRPASANSAIERNVDWLFDTARQSDQKFVFADGLRMKFNRSALNPAFGGPPSLDLPMQHLSARAALYTAGLVNCRLPTAEEWAAALALDPKEAATTPTAGPDHNLRDSTWQLQQSFAGKAGGQWPDDAVSGAFFPAGVNRTAKATTAKGDDQTLFFKPIGTGDGTFQNLIGNVSELVCSSPDLLESADLKTVGGIDSFCRQNNKSLAIIGGSAFSAPELDCRKPYPLKSESDAFADVGVRLAFTAPAHNLAERLKWVLDAQPFLAASGLTAASAVSPP